MTFASSLALRLTGQDESCLQTLEAQHRLSPATREAYLRLQHAARLDGIEIALVSSYRSFAAQVRIWQGKLQGRRPVYDANQRQVDVFALTSEEKVRAILLYSALPGASRHHWGTDFDIYDKAAVSSEYQVQLLDAEYAAGGPFYRLNQWLEEHAEAFGFFRPYREDTNGVAQERWHLSFFPESNALLEAFTLPMLQQAIAQFDCEEKDTIVALLPEIYTRYVKTICPPKTSCVPKAKANTKESL